MHICGVRPAAQVVREAPGARVPVGRSVYYYSQLKVAALSLDPGAMVKVGDVIEFEASRRRRLCIVVGEMEVNGRRVEEVSGPCEVGVQVGRWIRWGQHPIYRIDAPSA